MTAVMSEVLHVRSSSSLPDRPARFYPGRHGDRALVRAAGPVLDQLVQDLAGTRMSVVVTNAWDDVVDSGRSDLSLTLRPDPFADAATVTVSAATAPISDPGSGLALGAIGLTSETAEALPLLRALAKRAAQEIEQRLVDAAGVSERLLLQRFLRRRRGAKGPLVLLTEQAMIPNAAAARLLDPDDEPVLRQGASRLRRGDDGDTATLVLRSGCEVTAVSEPIADGQSGDAAVLRLTPGAADDRDDARTVGSRPTFGWGSLTDTERAVMELVTDGFTNQEAAERLFMSRHTVGSHLRSIFRKLDVGSRVDLTRLVMARSIAGDRHA